MIGKILNKIKSVTEELDHSMSILPWNGLWSGPKVVYRTTKYLLYRPTHSIIKGLQYMYRLGQTWRQDIRPKIPLGNPDVYFDIKENKTTNRDYGVTFDPLMKKKGHDEDIRLKVPRYKLPQRSIQQFEAWLESSEEDKKNKDFVPKSSDKSKLSNDEKKAYNQLIRVYVFLKQENASITVDEGELIIKIDVFGKTLEQIEEKVKHCCSSLCLPDDKKMVSTIAMRLYKKAHDHEISSNELFTKEEQQQILSESDCSSPPYQNIEEDISRGTIEDSSFEHSSADMKQKIMMKSALSQQDSNLDNARLGFLEQASNTKEEEQMNNNTQNNDQFSLTNPREFPNNVVTLQLEKNPNELQSDLILRSQSSFHVESTSDVSMASEVKEIVEKGLQDVSLNRESLNIKPSYYSGANRISRCEEIRRR